MGYIDSHAHLPARPGAREKLLALMSELDIETTVVVPGGSMSPATLSQQITLGGSPNIDIDNETLWKECQQSNGKLIPFFFANPHRSAELYSTTGKKFAGLKLGPAVHGIALLDFRNRDLVDVAQSFSHPIYLHCLSRVGFQVSDLVQLAKQFPKATFILGHAGVGNFDLYAISLIQSSGNIFFETSGGFSSVVSAAVTDLGPDRVLFGTEYPLQHPRVEIEKARCLNLTRDDFEKYTRTNVLNLLGGKHV